MLAMSDVSLGQNFMEIKGGQMESRTYACREAESSLDAHERGHFVELQKRHTFYQ